MRGRTGDRVVIVGHRVGEAERSARIIKVRGADGAPPYLVRWDDNGSESMLYPGSDARVVPVAGDDRAEPAARPRGAGRSSGSKRRTSS